MLFFQAVLLAGYGYAVIVSKLPFHLQGPLQLLILGLALLSLPLGLSESWANSVPATGNPSLWLLACLSAVVGLPFFIVSSNGPLLQKWFTRTETSGSRDPYFLYAASNAGSLVALLSYPVLLEPNFKLRWQSLLWTIGYGLLFLLVALCGLAVWGRSQKNVSVAEDVLAPDSSKNTLHVDTDTEVISLLRRLRWVLLAFVPSSLMLGVTNYISTDIASVPLLWVIPLALYLLTLILAFARRQLISPSLLSLLLPVATLLFIVNNLLGGAINTKLTIVFNLVYFFIAALTCHQQLAVDRPSTDYLTEFYFWLSLGGVLGGVFNALLAPAIFTSVTEYPLMVLLACFFLPTPAKGTEGRRSRMLDYVLPVIVLVVALALGWAFSFLAPGWSSRLVIVIATSLFFLFRKRPVRFVLCLAAVLLATSIDGTVSDHAIHVERNFFGVLRVSEEANESMHWLFHGSTNHGRQSTLPDHKCEALSYYHRTGPLGQVFKSFQASPATKDVAIVGLGTGATAVYALPNERWTFYEINPAVVSIARDPKYFNYLSDCSSVPVNIVLGDARLRLRDAANAAYGLIVLDAFSSDAIPVHLITRDAVDLYLSKLAPGGLIVFHISNRHMDLGPVMADLAASRKLHAVGMYDTTPFNVQGKDTSVWVVMARDDRDIVSLVNSPFARTLTADERRRVWTDDYSNILSVLRWR